MVSDGYAGHMVSARLPQWVQIEPVKDFAGGSAAHSAAALTGVNLLTATLRRYTLREAIAEQIDSEAPELPAG